MISVRLARSLRANSASSNAGSNGSGGDVRDRRGHPVHQRRQHHVAERALVDEAQVGPAVLEAQADPQVLLRRRLGIDDEELAAHPQVSEQRLPGSRQRQPQVFATALGRQQRAALEPGGRTRRRPARAA
ncbi:hypothetical protein GCM10020001_027600 [Nonomuraea salmonea]